jgi:hypothetical protein
VLLKPEECAMLLVDFQAGLGLVLSPSHGNSWSIMLWDWTNRGCFQGSGHRVDIRIPSLQRSLASGVAGGSSGRKTYRAQRHETSGRMTRPEMQSSRPTAGD